MLYTIHLIAGARPNFMKVAPIIRELKNLKAFGICLPDTIVTTDPLPYMDFLNLFKDAEIVLTDSGGIQEETTALGVPCITLRENTERPITISAGTNILVGTSCERIISQATKALDGRGNIGRKPELWDGKSSQRIVQSMISLKDIPGILRADF